MMVVRDVFQAKYGKSEELAALFKEARSKWPEDYATRILTDASGRFFTVIVETEVESLSDWENNISRIFSMPEFGQWFARMTQMVESGQREFYHLAT